MQRPFCISDFTYFTYKWYLSPKRQTRLHLAMQTRLCEKIEGNN